MINYKWISLWTISKSELLICLSFLIFSFFNCCSGTVVSVCLSRKSKQKGEMRQNFRNPKTSLSPNSLFYTTFLSKWWGKKLEITLRRAMLSYTTHPTHGKQLTPFTEHLQGLAHAAPGWGCKTRCLPTLVELTFPHNNLSSKVLSKRWFCKVYVKGLNLRFVILGV